MNCHGNNEKENKNSLLKHMLHMILCCGLPMIIIGFLPVISRLSPGVSGILGMIAPFICPIMMIVMFVSIMSSGKKKSCCSSENDNFKNNEIQKINKETGISDN